MKKIKVKIMIVMGTRPEIVKLAPVIFELKKYAGIFRLEIVWSGQHVELAKPFLRLFKIKPSHYFNIMKPDQSLTDISSRTLLKLDALLKRKRPHLILVQGDTTTAFMASLCAYYNRIPVAHLEAGLRSGNPYQPFPEEKNRELISHLATYHFAPTLESKKNLLREGISPKLIFVTGNSVIDAVRWLIKKYPPPIKHGEKLIVVTVHRRESFGKPLNSICDAILKLANRHEDLQIIFPVHLNPNVRRQVFKKLGGQKRIHLTKPLDYVSFIHLMARAEIILSDSGGVQEEAPALGKPVLILRDATERPEGIKAGANLLVGRRSDKIVMAVERLLLNSGKHKKHIRASFPFGKGDTAVKVVKILKSIFST